jgi:ABC-type nitrate/sulfonate/bicarbonate transport system substrate-binding protein
LLIARRDQHKVAPLRITKEQGIFKKYGLDVDLVLSSTEGVVVMLKLMTNTGSIPKPPR